ncbi:MAG: phosphate acyltransferase PlsX, partial [Clostridia bacterium]|nr:phosphate acyltransferase PlsX [Clostridia bacterium]
EITNNDEPSIAIKHKKESSIVKAYDYMKEKDETAFISAGSTGAVMAGGLLKLKRITKVNRPALIAILPTDTGKGTILLDCGANTDAAPNSMVQYAEMGKLYASLVQNKENVSIGLLNIGAEEKKGSKELKESNIALKDKFPEFIGNIEARYILKGKADVIVAQGLMGNVALKAIEGTAKTLKDALVKELKKNLFTKIKALVTKSLLEKALYKYDYTKYGGAVLIGIRKPVIKIHGNAKSKNYEVAIYQANAILKQKLIKEIEKKMSENEKE